MERRYCQRRCSSSGTGESGKHREQKSEPHKECGAEAPRPQPLRPCTEQNGKHPSSDHGRQGERRHPTSDHGRREERKQPSSDCGRQAERRQPSPDHGRQEKKTPSADPGRQSACSPRAKIPRPSPCKGAEDRTGQNRGGQFPMGMLPPPLSDLLSGNRSGDLMALMLLLLLLWEGKEDSHGTILTLLIFLLL